MKLEELIIRIIGGGLVGVLIGMVLVIVPESFTPILSKIIGLLFGNSFRKKMASRAP